ncbi:MAG: GatB/YqeY domain-containing protein [Pseudomonadota bacterium]|nr:GatB/YqeY domain-containing protein [Pseudomonadota bacterium]
MSLKDRITEDMKAAMRAKDSERLSGIRMLLAAVKQREVDERIALADADVVAVIEKLIKQRRDSITQFQAANRQDLAGKEQAELAIYQAYMPQALSDAEVDAAIAAAIAGTGAAGMKDMGKVMAELRVQLAGRADMGKVSGFIKAKLST